MSARDFLTLTGSMKINKISKQRSRVTRRTIKHSSPNLQKKILNSTLGQMRLKIRMKTLRTIEKYGTVYESEKINELGKVECVFDKYLLLTKRSHLSPQAKLLRKKLINKLGITYKTHKEITNKK
jgi:ribosomal protein L28